MSVFNSINKLRSNIFGSRGVGKTTAISRQPGIQLADTSPTAILNKDPMDFSTLSYPRDLINDATNGHYMLFYINVQNKTKFPYTRAVDGVSVDKKKIEMRPVTETTATTTGTPQRQKTTFDVKTTYEEFESGGATNAVDIEQGFIDVDIDYGDVQLLRQDKTKMKTNLSDTDIMRNATVRIKESIAIYLPPNVQDNYATKYQGAETAILGFMAASGGKFLDAYRQNDFTKAAEILKDTAGGAFTEMGKRAAAAALDLVTGSQGALELGAKIFGATANPYMEVLFNGVDLRTFSYTFTFAPRDRKERDEVQEIIKKFRFYQAPELRSNQSMYMGLPAEFDIHYMYQPENGDEAMENPYYNKIATCVLTSCNVDYTPDGVKSHADGSPVLIKMTLEFLETEMITKDHVEAGY